MIGLPNVKIMDALIFVAAFLFGLKVGTGVAVSTWIVYGSVNPYGTDSPVLLGFLIAGECFYALGGAVLKRAHRGERILTSGDILLFVLVGFFATFAYDVLTNFATYLFITQTLSQALLFGMATGAPLALIHEVSNIVFFATVAPVAILATRRLDRRII